MKLTDEEIEFPEIDGLDPYVWDAANLIIENDKCSAGMLQRIFNIGFNHAAKIVDDLCSIGVVSEDVGTKPRKILVDKKQLIQIAKELKEKWSFTSNKLKRQENNSNALQENNDKENAVKKSCNAIISIIVQTYQNFGIRVSVSGVEFEDEYIIFGIVPNTGV